ncbi:MAG: hypothetical protein WA941_15440 [Nitrososphaeraceae archaeon]
MARYDILVTLGVVVIAIVVIYVVIIRNPKALEWLKGLGTSKTGAAAVEGTVAGDNAYPDCIIRMSLSYQDWIQRFCVLHMFEYRAINKQMTTCMRLKIRENIHIQHPPPPQGQLAYKNHFG